MTSTVSQMLQRGPLTGVDFGSDCTARRGSIDVVEAM